MSRALGRYELLRPLARGGMAEVYLARRRAAGVEKWLVVKRIRPERSGDVRFLDLFVREARLSMSLAHQNIVPVFDFGRIDDQVFLAMERIEGKDLSSCLTRAGDRRLPPLLAAFIAAECCQALDYAHHRKSPEGIPLGIVHRDVTPRNVLLSWSGEVKLTDFGIASLAGESTKHLVGTPSYMAPEQARGEPVDARADVYAVGLVLREALTGQRARPGTDRDALVEAAKSGVLQPWPPGQGGPLVTIIEHATAARAEDRYPDARTMLADLDAFIVSERAANKGDAPARALAAWLDAVWGGTREEENELDGNIDAQHLVSFMDDGALDVIGTGTQRSLAATAADDGEGAEAGERSSGGPTIADDAAARPHTLARASDQLPATRPADASTDRTAPVRAPVRTGARWLIPVLLIALGAAGAVAVAAMRADDDRPRAVAADKPVAAVDKAAVDKAAADKLAADKLAADKRPPRGDKHGPAHPGGSGSATSTPATGKPGAGSAVPAIVLRKVTINVKPGWANFTVDDDATPHETPSTIELAPGRHRLHFSNPISHVEKDATITVPPDRDLGHVEQLDQ